MCVNFKLTRDGDLLSLSALCKGNTLGVTISEVGKSKNFKTWALAHSIFTFVGWVFYVFFSNGTQLCRLLSLSTLHKGNTLGVTILEVGKYETIKPWALVCSIFTFVGWVFYAFFLQWNSALQVIKPEHFA